LTVGARVGDRALLDPAGEAESAALLEARAEIERLRVRLEHADRQVAHLNRVIMVGELAATIAHELSQPLGAILINAGAGLRWLSGEPPRLGEVEAAFRRIVEDSFGASKVIERIRRFLERGETQRTWIDLNEVVGDVVIMVEGPLRRSGITLRTALATPLPRVRGDEVRLQQVVFNLMVNGVEAMTSDPARERGGELLVTTRGKAGEQVTVEVRDTGRGLDPAVVARLFEPFFTTKRDGLGLGLAICRAIVQAHGGRLEAAGNGERGATFRFTVPIDQGQ
jgi:two-component system sensor kinase FixL